jgi:hypothetical protein
MPDRMLPLYLWDLRAQVEAQLRALTDVQRQVDAMLQLTPKRRREHLAKIVEHLTGILEANASIRQVSNEALDAAREVLAAGAAVADTAPLPMAIVPTPGATRLSAARQSPPAAVGDDADTRP